MQSSHRKNDAIQNISAFTLHEIIRTSKDISEIKEFLSKSSHEEQVAMAHSVDINGLLPIKTILNTSLPLHQMSELCDLILSLTSEQTCLPLTSIINDRDFQSLPHSPLRANLMLGVKIVNLARKHNLQSITHPQKSVFTIEEKTPLMKKLRLLKKLEFELTVKMLLNSSDDHFHENKRSNAAIDISNDQLLETQITLLGSLFKERGVGNCYELAILGLYYCQKLKAPVNYEAYMSNGDHVFVVIGRDKNSHPSNYKTWEESTVVCDPWSGLVCSVSELESKLKDYDGLQIKLLKNNTVKHYNILVNFNPHYHILTPLNLTQKSINISPSVSFAATYKFADTFHEAPLKIKVFFETTILKRVKDALNKKIICEQDIHELKDPFTTLLCVFRDKYGKYFLLYKLITLQEADALSLEVLSTLFNKDNFTRLLQSYGREIVDPTLFSSDGRPKKYKLHSLVRACKAGNTDLLEAYLFKYNANLINWMAKTRDENDKLPYEYITLEFPCELKRYLHTLIWPYTHAKNCLPLTERINFIDVMDLTVPLTSKRNEHLKFAVKLINLVRKENLQSSTHPTTKGEDLININEKIYFLREEVYEKKHDLYLTEFSEEAFSQIGEDIIMDVDEKMKWQLLELEANLIRKVKAGNCGEMSTLALYHSKLLNRDMFIERVGFTDASHTVLVIGRDPNSNINNYRTWGDNTIVCDPWAGEAYSATQLELRLKCHRVLEAAHNDKIYNVLIHYHPELHTLKLHQQSSTRKTNLSASLAFAEKFNLTADFEKISLKQKYFFARHTLFYIEKALSKGYIKNEEILSLKHAFRTLFTFSSKNTRRFIKQNLTSLQKVDDFYSEIKSEKRANSSRLFTSPILTSSNKEHNTQSNRCG